MSLAPIFLHFNQPLALAPRGQRLSAALVFVSIAFGPLLALVGIIPLIGAVVGFGLTLFLFFSGTAFTKAAVPFMARHCVFAVALGVGLMLLVDNPNLPLHLKLQFVLAVCIVQASWSLTLAYRSAKGILVVA